MARLTEGQWASLRATWERDPRKGFTWLAEECGLQVSAPAIRKACLRDGWAKVPEELMVKHAEKKSTKVSRKLAEKVSRKKVSRKKAKPEKLSPETLMTQKPATNANEITAEPLKISITPADFLPANFANAKQAIFARALLETGSIKSASTMAEVPYTTGHYWSTLPAIATAWREYSFAVARTLDFAPENVIVQAVAALRFDHSKYLRAERVCCRFCHSTDGKRQITQAEDEMKREKWEQRRNELLAADPDRDIGEYEGYAGEWYDPRKDINPDCPNCHGEGILRTFYDDLRKLTPLERAAIQGIEETESGAIRVNTMSKDKALDVLAKIFGFYKDKEEKTVINNIAINELNLLHQKLESEADELQARILKERGIVDVVGGE